MEVVEAQLTETKTSIENVDVNETHPTIARIDFTGSNISEQ